MHTQRTLWAFFFFLQKCNNPLISSSSFYIKENQDVSANVNTFFLTVHVILNPVSPLCPQSYIRSFRDRHTDRRAYSHSRMISRSRMGELDYDCGSQVPLTAPSGPPVRIWDGGERERTHIRPREKYASNFLITTSLNFLCQLSHLPNKTHQYVGEKVVPDPHGRVRLAGLDVAKAQKAELLFLPTLLLATVEFLHKTFGLRLQSLFRYRAGKQRSRFVRGN